MGKALVIKGASFAANKVTTVTLSEVVPCESITLDKNSIAFTTLNETSTITPTVLPVDTSDVVTWSSSNTDIATVADGVVTCTGVGTATITATCGSYTATCSVSATVTINLNESYASIAGYRYNSSLDFTTDPTKNYITMASSDNSLLFYDADNTLNGYKAVYTNSSNRQALKYVYPIPIPSGDVSTITIHTPDSIPVGNSRICFALTDANTQQHYSGMDTEDGTACAGLAHKFMNNYQGAGDLVFSTLSDYPTANSFIVTIMDNNSEDTSGITGITATFS